MANTTIYLLRHGDILNPLRLLYLQLSDPEFRLSPVGEQQILAQAEKLKGKSVMAIYHSGLVRSKQSAELIESVLHTSDVKEDLRLMDNYSPIQGTTLDEFDRLYEGTLYHPDLQAMGGESMEDVKNRMLAVFQDTHSAYPDQAVVAISHGDPIGIVWLVAEDKPLERRNLGNDRNPVAGIPYPTKGSVSVLNFDGETLKKKEYWPPV